MSDKRNKSTFEITAVANFIVSIGKMKTLLRVVEHIFVSNGVQRSVACIFWKRNAKDDDI